MYIQVYNVYTLYMYMCTCVYNTCINVQCTMYVHAHQISQISLTLKSTLLPKSSPVRLRITYIEHAHVHVHVHVYL